MRNNNDSLTKLVIYKRKNIILKKRIRELEDIISKSLNVKDIKSRIELEKKYSEEILVRPYKEAIDTGNWDNFNVHLNLKEASEARISALRWVIKEVNLEQIEDYIT